MSETGTPGARESQFSLKQARVIGTAKTSGVAFLDIARRAWDERAVVMIGKTPNSGIDAGEWHEPASAGGWWSAPFAPDDSEELAQISTTSGTTGEPKAIAISRRAVSDTVARLVEHMELTSEIREYIGVPVTFSFGLARARAAGAVGGSVYLPENGFRPDEIANMLREGEINALSAVPTMLRTLIANPELVADAGSALRWLEIGSQYMSGEEKRAIRELFPNAAILQHYGLTEASRSTFLRIDRASDTEIESIGRAVGDGELTITETGQIAVRGSHQASGVLAGGTLQSLTDAEGWLVTSDLGEISDGALFYRGRNDDVANIGGVKVSAEHFEQKLARRFGVPAFGAVCIMNDQQRGQKLGVALLPEAPENWRDLLRAEIAGAGLVWADVTALEMDELPRTETGKLQRKKLAQQLEERASLQTVAGADDSQSDLNEDEERIAKIWRDVLSVPTVKRTDTFLDLGGDSLSAISVMLKMEKAGIPESLSQQIFEGRSVAEIAASMGEADDVRPISLQSISANAINFTRGILVLLVIGSHWGPFIWTRAGELGEAFAVWSWPLFRAGTPGFAMVFGLGLGFFWLQTARENPKRLKQRFYTSFLIVGSGLAIIALLRAMRLWIAPNGSSADWPTMIFYDVLLFYTLAVATLYPLLRHVARAKWPVLITLALMTISFVISELFQPLLDSDTSGLARLGALMLSSNYSYPLMLGYVLAGLAAGIWIKHNCEDPRLALKSVSAGLALFIAGIAITFALGIEDRWFVGIPTKPAVVTYLGAILLLFALAHTFQRRLDGQRFILFRIMMLLGILALPAYVLHAAAFPGRELLSAIGLPDLVAVGIPVALVFVVLAAALRKVYRFYFGIAKR